MSPPAHWSLADVPDQGGRVAVVTGATSGLGLETAGVLARRGARVFLACRDPRRGAAVAERLARGAAVAPAVLAVDLAELGSVAAAAERLAEEVDHVDVLVNNAGIMAVPHTRTVDGFESQFGTNHLGHFALTGHLLPLLLARGARVVTTSSQLHRLGTLDGGDPEGLGRYRPFSAYARSKLANLLFALELDRRATAHGVPVVSVAAHPGYAATNLARSGPARRAGRLGLAVTGLGERLLAQPAASGALPQVRAATEPGVPGGTYFGPSGLLELRGRPVRVAPSRRARDVERAAALWVWSERASGVVYAWDGGDAGDGTAG
jgi:NAD(P)-dependent dehydrogenase (short-subunit alcohol dehydrogenase family)